MIINNIKTWRKVVEKYNEYYKKDIEITIASTGVSVLKYNYDLYDYETVYIDDKDFKSNDIDEIVFTIHQKLEGK